MFMLSHEFGKLADVNLNLMNAKIAKSPLQYSEAGIGLLG
jgi:hypothetical protein